MSAVIIAGRLAAATLGAALLGAAAVAVSTARVELLAHAPSPHAVSRPTGEPWLEGASDVRLQTPSGVAFRGWQIASTNGSGVVLVDGSDSDRTQLLPEARALAAAGYGLLMFDRPGNGESQGQKLRGDEPDFVRLAVDALAGDPGLKPGRLGALGFSSGAAFLSEASARDTRLQAVVLEGCYADESEFIRHYGGRGLVRGWSALLALRWAGYPSLRPVAAVPALAPRALFLIAGDADPIVPWHSSEQLYAAASEPKEIWIVHGAAHGNYASAAGDTYAQRLVGFFDRTLRGRDGVR